MISRAARPRLAGVQKKELKSHEGPMKKRIATSGCAKIGRWLKSANVTCIEPPKNIETRIADHKVLRRTRAGT